MFLKPKSKLVLSIKTIGAWALEDQTSILMYDTRFKIKKFSDLICYVKCASTKIWYIKSKISRGYRF